MRRRALFFLFLLCLVNIGWMWRENPKVDEYMKQGYQAYKEGNLSEALNAYENVLIIKPEKIEAINFIGVIYEEMNLSQKAEEKYLTAIKFDRDYLPAYFNLGFLYWNQGDKVKAINCLQKRVKMGNPKDPWTIKAQRALKSIQTTQGADRQKMVDQTIDQINLQAQEVEPIQYNDKARQGMVYRALDQIEQRN